MTGFIIHVGSIQTALVQGKLPDRWPGLPVAARQPQTPQPGALWIRLQRVFTSLSHFAGDTKHNPPQIRYGKLTFFRSTQTQGLIFPGPHIRTRDRVPASERRSRSPA